MEKSSTASALGPFPRVKFCGGVAHFYPPLDFNALKIRRLRLVSRLHFIRAWGRRAEDPFRGLRAGPVRTSPHFCRDLQLFQPRKRLAPKTPQDCISPTGGNVPRDLRFVYESFPNENETSEDLFR